MTSLREELIAHVRSRVGARWEHQGRSDTAMDCAGLILDALHTHGLSSFDLRDYERLPDGVELLQICDRELVRIAVADLQAGDVVLLQFDGKPTHLAIVVPYKYGGLALIHSSNQFGRVVEHRFSVDWRARVVAAYRMPGVPA